MARIRSLPEFVDILSQRELGPSAPAWVDTPLGRGVEVHSRAWNLLARDLSLGRSLAGLNAHSPLSLETGPGWAGDGTILWEPRSRGDVLEIELPEVDPALTIRGSGAGIFVAICLSMRLRTDVALSLEISGTTEKDYEPKPGFVAANPGAWQRISATVRAVSKDRPTARLCAHGPGRVRLDALQLDPRPYPVWMMTEPMRTGMWGRWTEGGTMRDDDRLWAELKPTGLGRAGTIALWFAPDWPASEFPHVLLDAGFDVLGLAFNNGRLIGAAGGSQVWVYGSGEWRHMMRFEPHRWHLAALSWALDGSVSLYVDGECYARRKTPAALRLDPSRLSGRLHLGCPSQDAGFQEQPDMPGRLDGRLADVRLYPEPLDDAAVAAIHLNGRSRLESPPPEIVDVRLGRDELVTESTFYCWFPNKLAKMLDGSIQLFCGSSPDYGLQRPPYWPRHRLHFRKSNLDASWQPFHSGWVLGGQPTRLPDGRWLSWVLAAARPADQQRQGAFASYVVSEDGKEWAPFDARLDLPEHETFHVSQIVVDHTERVLLCGLIQLKATCSGDHASRRPGAGTGHGETHLCLAESRDSGRTFQFLSFITEGQSPPWGDYCEENALIDVTADRPVSEGVISGPELLLVGRIRGHQVPCVQTRSIDGGRSWSALELCPFGAVFPRLRRLENGVVILLTGRPETVLHWTVDGGRHWSPPVSLYDSRDQPMQSENIWYGPSTGYGSMTEVEPNRVWVSYDRLGAYDPSAPKRTNQVRVRDVRVERIPAPTQRVTLDDFQFIGEWWRLGEVAWTDDPAARAELSFQGTGIVLDHPVLRHGGGLVATMDGKVVRTVSCYDPLPHHRRGRTVLATGLEPGTHVLVLIPDLSSKERHAHGDGAELSGILSWLHLAHCRSDRWSGICGAYVL